MGLSVTTTVGDPKVRCWSCPWDSHQPVELVRADAEHHAATTGHTVAVATTTVDRITQRPEETPAS